MNTSKFLTSTAAALAVVGAVGLSYAQTSTDSSTGKPLDPAMQTPNTDGSAATMNRGSSGATTDGTTGPMSNGSTGNMNNGSTGPMGNGSTGSMSKRSAAGMNNGSTGSMNRKSRTGTNDMNTDSGATGNAPTDNNATMNERAPRAARN